MRRQIIPLLIVFLLSCKIYAFDIQIPVHYDTLKNGLRVILVPDTNIAVVSCKLYYFAGSMYEGPGTTGLSHLYEHMMFKGTKKIGTKDYKKEIPYMASIDSLDILIGQLRQKGIPEDDSLFSAYRAQIFSLLDKQRQYIVKDEIWEMYKNNGGTNLNAWTGDDMTAYIVTLPKNKLELYFWIESDRMKNPVLREFYSERDVVTEERGMRYDNRPLNRYWERFSALFYIAHPYRLPTIGWMSDIRAYTRKKLYDHIRRFYTPDNGLLILVGNINIQQTMSKIKQYFEPIPRGNFHKEEVVTREPHPIGETRFTVYESVQPRIDILYHTPGYPHKDLYDLDVIEGVLNGRSGRLYKRLVNEEKLCVNAGAGNAYKLHNSYFYVFASLKNNTDAKRVEQIIMEELDKVVTNPPTQKEMERIKNNIQMGFTTRLKKVEGLSDQLAWFERLRTWKDLI
ncbi:MAG: pitrilysin family protein, partial [Chitinispirillia bacterium]